MKDWGLGFRVWRYTKPRIKWKRSWEMEQQLGLWAQGSLSGGPYNAPYSIWESTLASRLTETSMCMADMFEQIFGVKSRPPRNVVTLNDTHAGYAVEEVEFMRTLDPKPGISWDQHSLPCLHRCAMHVSKPQT